MKSVEKDFNSNSATIILEVEIEDDGIRLDEAVKRYLLSQSRQVIKSLIKEKRVELISRKTKNSPSTKVFHRDLISVRRFNEGFKINIKNLVLFEDDYFIAINKPKGYLVHPTGIHHFNCISVHIEEYLKTKIYPIHRLDKKTSGVLIFAKSKDIASKMRRLFDEHKVEKKYFFKSSIESGLNIPEKLETYMEDANDKKISLKQRVSEKGKVAITLFSNIEKNDKTISGYAYPKTGRLHQIRCHLSYLGYPIVGDHVYGNFSKEDELQLECIQMKFKHPILNKELNIML
ncbi:MAG: RluA family pseudouridine synthase [Bacteriovoracaceae bacterium]|jgi:RluA family pseudouridine synthase|nr:RluA family pseudouridine synthase [Bacteriovoracaceae bacterium]